MTTQKQRDHLFVDFARRLRPFDATLFGLFLFDRVALPGGVPTGVVLTALLLLLAVFRKPIYRVRTFGSLVVVFGLIALFLAAESMYNGVDFFQRLVRIVMLFALTLVVAQGRYHLYSAVVGLCFAVIAINTPMFYLGLTTNYYPPFLTGWFGDKNVSGMWYALILILGFYVVRYWYSRLLWLALAGTCLYLTGSRTSLSAATIALIWIATRNRIAPVFRLPLAGLLMWLLFYAEENLAHVGSFSERLGSDQFRALVEAAMAEKVANAPWYGMGLTTSTVNVGVRTEFFHNSYLALLVEGGYPTLIVILGIYLFVAIGLFNGRSWVPLRERVGEAAAIVILVCAWKLGEVFFTSAAALALGFAFWARLGVPVAVHHVKGVSEEMRAFLGSHLDEKDDMEKVRVKRI